ncbi:MAG: HAD family phosphatase [archaeon]
MTMRRATFFDIDGTLIKSQMIFDFPRYLHKVGLFEEKHILNIIKIIVEYEINFIPYREAGKRILKIYAEALKGKKKSLIEQKSCDFIVDHIKKKYAYTDELIDLLKKHTVLIAISASPIEPVAALKKHIPFSHVFGTVLETKNGIYTGKIKTNLLVKNSKQKAQLSITKKLDIDLKNSFAFGDSDADIEYLALVGHPIALNPNHHLKDIAEKNNWHIFHEKDDIVEKIRQILVKK